jgi:ubiquinone/menaquinone biosynthesis C-methylase UbiE
MMKRHPSHELLDSDSGSPQEIAGTIRDLQMFNQFFGGVSTSLHLVRRAACNLKKASLLEVAAGAGYVPQQVSRAIAHHLDLQITLLDRSRAHLNGAARAVVADALHLPFADNSFDFVSCNLFVHHLSPEDVSRFTAEALRVCRTAFLVNDLVRDPIHLALAYAGFPLYRSRLTRNDAPASVRQAYTPEEVLPLLESAGAAQIELTRHYLYRMGIIAWKAPRNA